MRDWLLFTHIVAMPQGPFPHELNAQIHAIRQWHLLYRLWHFVDEEGKMKAADVHLNNISPADLR